MSDSGSGSAADEAPDIDPDVIAVAFMVRQAMVEVARLKSPENPERELKRMRDEVLQTVKKFRFSNERTAAEVRIREAVYSSVIALTTLGTDNSTVQ